VKKLLAETYAELFAQSPDPGFITTADGAVIDANAAMLALFGYTRGDLPQLSAAALYCDPTDRARLRSQLEAHGCVREFETVMRAADGRDIECLITAVVSTSTDGTLTVFAGTLRDVTHARLTERELRHALRLDSVGRLAAGIAHEINTPSQYVGDSIHFLKTSFAELHELIAVYRGAMTQVDADTQSALVGLERRVELDYLCEHVPRACERALAGMERIGEVVRAMRSFAVVGPADMSPADINEAVRTTLTVARGEYKRVADVVLDLGELPLVPCHVADVRHVLLNLVTNAAEAIRQRGADPARRGTITVRSIARARDVELCVTDDGNGISAEHRDRIFEPFFTTKPVGRGIGEGLASARTLVERNGGTIRFDSAPGLGSTFYVTLPLEQCARITAPDVEQTAGSAGG
jgi:PAS domain S-box-containing protein